MIKKNMDINYYKIYLQNKKKLYCYPPQFDLHISQKLTEWETNVSRNAVNNFMIKFQGL